MRHFTFASNAHFEQVGGFSKLKHFFVMIAPLRHFVDWAVVGLLNCDL